MFVHVSIQFISEIIAQSKIEKKTFWRRCWIFFSVSPAWKAKQGVKSICRTRIETMETTSAPTSRGVNVTKFGIAMIIEKLLLTVVLYAHNYEQSTWSIRGNRSVCESFSCPQRQQFAYMQSVGIHIKCDRYLDFSSWLIDNFFGCCWLGSQLEHHDYLLAWFS